MCKCEKHLIHLVITSTKHERLHILLGSETRYKVLKVRNKN